MKHLFFALALVASCFAMNIDDDRVHLLRHKEVDGNHVYLYYYRVQEKFFALLRKDPLPDGVRIPMQEILDTSLLLDFKAARKIFKPLLKGMKEHYGLEIEEPTTLVVDPPQPTEAPALEQEAQPIIEQGECYDDFADDDEDEVCAYQT
jgi:hypothetical protein